MASGGASLPTTFNGVESWLEALNMGKYIDAFKKAGIQTADQLRHLTDTELKTIGVSLAGHRKRLTLGITALFGEDAVSAMEVEAPAPETSKQTESQKLATKPRFNSTSSIFINSTIMKPDIDEIIFCVAVVIHDRVEQGEQLSRSHVEDPFPFFSEENNPLYKKPAERTYTDETKKKKREIPGEETIFHTIQSVYECANFPSECLIISLVYIERLSATSGVPLLVTSWRPILLAALILAQKVWDDRSLQNSDFSLFCPMFTLAEINHLEKKFLELIDHDVSVNASLYASYYFQLRTLCQRENREFKLKMLEAPATAALESRSFAYTSQFKREASARLSQSANAIPAVIPGR